MKIFRWSGLIGFVVVLALLLVVGLLFIDNWVKSGLERGGTQVNRAEVNVRSVNLTLSPLGFDIRGVQVTDINNPGRNAFELDEARLAVNLPQLFLGRINIDDLIVEGMRTNTERQRPGRVLPVAEPEGPGLADQAREQASARLDALRGELPDAQTVGSQATAETRSEVEQARQAIDGALERAQQAMNDLPDQASIDDYDRRITALRDRNIDSLDAIRSVQSDLSSLTQQVAADQQSVAQARQAARNAVATSQDAVDDVLAAPARDWAALREAYPLNQESAVRAGRLLLGDEIFDRVEQVQGLYRQVSPWLDRLLPDREAAEAGPERLTGRFVRFDHPNPRPNFLLSEGRIGFEADGWPWALHVNDVTGQQRLINRPVTLRLNRGERADAGMEMTGTLDRRGEQREDRFTLSGRNLGMNPRTLELGGADVDWDPGRVDLTGSLAVIDNALDGQLALTFDQTGFRVPGSDQVATLLARALSGVEQFEVGVVIGGRVNAPSLQITSDLDNRLGDAIGRIVREEYDRWLAQARQALDAEVARLRAPVDAGAQQVRDQRDQVEQRAEAFQTQVVERIEQLRQELADEQDRLTGQLDAERRRLEEERRQAEEASRRQAEDAARESLQGIRVPGF
ncbi:MAG: TIGR03545 family protein [Saccharospirillum sp.]